MKKALSAILSLVVVVACLSGCSGGKKVNTILNITESNYLLITEDIYKNPTDYTGRTVKIEGLFEADGHGEHSHYYVYRYAPVYNGEHGHVQIQKLGFEVSYKGDMPKDNDWIEIVGVLQSRISHGNTILVLEADSITVLEERGAEIIGDIEAIIHDDGEDDEHEHTH